MSPITTHILDISQGRPATGVQVSLSLLSSNGDLIPIGHKKTDADGRITDLTTSENFQAGNYRLTFETAKYFSRLGQDSFYPFIEITFQISDPNQHYHVPVLLSPYGYTTYRGS